MVIGFRLCVKNIHEMSVYHFDNVDDNSIALWFTTMYLAAWHQICEKPKQMYEFSPLKHWYTTILGMGSANERQCYNATSPLTGWAHLQNDPSNHIRCQKHSITSQELCLKSNGTRSMDGTKNIALSSHILIL